MAPTLAEIFPGAPRDPAAVGFALSRGVLGDGPVLWVQDRPSRQETGRPYLPGLMSGPGISRPFLCVEARRPVDVLWAMEEGLRCRALSAVIGEIWGAPAALNFTATKRLALRAEESGVPAWLIRGGAEPDLSAARERWRVSSLPSAVNPDDPKAPGDPQWVLELFRARGQRPGKWIARHDRAAHRLDLTAPLRDGTVDGRGAEAPRRAG